MTPRAVLGFLRSIVVYRLNVVGQLRQRRLYRQFVRPGDLVFDVGAHVGGRIWAFRALGCRVVAVEPQGAFCKFLRVLYGQAGDVDLESCALGAEAGAAEMLISRGNPTLSSLSTDWVENAGDVKGFSHVSWDDHQQVSLETLDALIARHGTPQFCKIDVEGYERDVLRGLTRPIPTLSFEFLTAQHHLAASCMEEIARLGSYTFNITYGERSVLMLDEWCSVPDMVAHLGRLPSHVSSGDIYAQAANCS